MALKRDDSWSAIPQLEKKIKNSLKNLEQKQDKLISGLTLKTINGNSLLGSGNITISGGGGGASTWDEISGKPSVFPPEAHDHTISNITDFPTIPSLDGYATETWVEGKGYLTEHQDISGKQDKLTAGSNITITDNVISASGGGGGASTWEEITGKPSTFPPSYHRHSVGDIQNFPTLSAVATSGNYDDLTNKPTIPSAVTESTVSGWGFTKNTGTYSKPSGGIPKTDLASAVQTSLDKADSAIQDISGKQDKLTAGANISIVGNVISASGGGGGSSSWNDITDKPDTFPPSTHTHTTDDLTNYGTMKPEASKTGAVVKSTAQTLCGISLEAGTWLLLGYANFEGASSGTTQYARQIAIATGTATDGAYRQRFVAPSNQTVTLCVPRIVELSATTTYNLNAYSTYSTGFTTSGRLQAYRLK